jgi:glycosyltransferase involved in cell wall biosynthesis
MPALGVLHIVAPTRVGGLERVVWALATGHARMGWPVQVATVVSPEDHENALIRALRDSGVQVDVLALPARAYGKERAAIADLCRRSQPAVVHTHGYRPDVLDAGVARGLMRERAVVTTVHGFTGGDWKNRFYEWLQVRAYRGRRFDAVVAVSSPIVERLTRAGVPAGRVRLIRNAWSGAREYLDRAAARRVLGLPAEDPVIGWVGRLSAEKGPDVMIDALARLRYPGASVRLAMLGDGPLAADLRERAQQAGVADRVTWHGVVPDAARLYRAFDVLALSSRTEGTPIVLFEAMGAEVPVVATAVGGVPDVVTAAEAVLAPSQDPAALARALGRTLGDPAGARARAAAARRRLETDFAVAPWLARYAALYREVVAGKSGRREVGG